MESYMKLKQALEGNRKLQQRLLDTMTCVEEGITSNASMQARLDTASRRSHRLGWYTGLNTVNMPSVGKVNPKTIGPSRFWMAAGTVPEPNADTSQLLQAYAYLPHCFTVSKWSREEDKSLLDAILQVANEVKQEKFLEGLAEQGETLESNDLDQRCSDIAISSLEDAGVDEQISAFGDAQWDLIAAQTTAAQSRDDCKIRWTNHLRLLVKGGHAKDSKEQSWSTEEDEKLTALAKKHKERKWEQIAKELGSTRSAGACLSHFRQRRTAVEKPWTAAEIEQLKTSHAKHAGKGSFWKAVAADLPGRSHNAVMHYWRNNMDKTVRKGKWTAEEDEALIAAVKALGTKWARVAEIVPTRNQIQCRERWVNSLDPSRKSEPFSAREDAILLQGIQECKNPDGSVRWAEIARRLPGRTDDQASNHAITLRQFLGQRKKQEEAKKKPQQAAKPATLKRRPAAPAKALQGSKKRATEEPPADDTPLNSPTLRSTRYQLHEQAKKQKT